MKKLLLLLTVSFSISASAQDDKTVTLTVSGQGKTQDEAKQVALRSAIEQAFGAFISSKTEILNDNLVKDEIVSVTNGNIQKFDVLSEMQLPNGGYATTLKVVVSVVKLTSFVESKGVEVEFKGGLFAVNIKMQKLNEDAELSTMKNLAIISKDIAFNSFDYKLVVNNPKSVNGDNNQWDVEFETTAKFNKNIDILYKYIDEQLPLFVLSKSDIKEYRNLNKSIYQIIYKNQNYYLRNKNSVVLFNSIADFINKSAISFKIANNKSTYYGTDILKNLSNNNVEKNKKYTVGLVYAIYSFRMRFSFDQLSSINKFTITPEGIVNQQKRIYGELIPSAEELIDIFSQSDVDKEPSLSGGSPEGLFNLIYKDINYPQMEKEGGIQGEVEVAFYIDKSGLVTKIRLLTGDNKSFINTVVRAIKKLPQLTPASNNNENIGVWKKYNIFFSLI